MLKNKGRSKRELLTTNGKLEFSRTLLVPANPDSISNLAKIQKEKSVCPLDIMLGINDLPFKVTIQMMIAIAKEAVRASSYKRATQVITERYGIDINEKRVRLITDFIGETVYEHCKKEAEIAKAEFDIPIDRRKKHKNTNDILYIEMDGAMVDTRPEAEGDNSWRECKIAIVFLSADIKTWINKHGEERRMIRKKLLTGYIGSYKEFQYHLLSIAAKYHYKYRNKIIIISDGADWIHKIKEHLFPEAIHILDLAHVKEHVFKFSKWIYKDDEALAQQWANGINAKIENSEVDAVLSILDEYKDRKPPKEIGNLYSYIKERRELMDYKIYIDRGYFIGSGASESANKYTMQSRMKLPGMRWNVSNAQWMLTLKTFYESDQWNTIEPIIKEYFELLS